MPKNKLRVSLSDPINQEYATKLSLIGVFIAFFAAFLRGKSKSRKQQGEGTLKPFDLALLGLATFRLGRLVSYDRIADPLRKPFTKTIPDPTGAGDTVEPRGEGVQQAIGQLISCPICAGTWIAAALVYGLQIFPNATRIFLAMISSTGIAELLNALTEAWSWTGQAARKRAGMKKNIRVRVMHAPVKWRRGNTKNHSNNPIETLNQDSDYLAHFMQYEEKGSWQKLP